jgi:predicted DsbA family dithiol-disulfide isomerase
MSHDHLAGINPNATDVDGDASVLHFFDFVCPFCYVAQERNDILRRYGLDVVHLPFQIHPEIPAAGIEAGERVGPMYEALEQEAARAGLPLSWPARLPNTRTALAAAVWVRMHQPDVSDNFNKALFAAHFALREDLGDVAVIERHANEVGVDVDAFREALKDGTALDALAQVESVGAWLGVQATPSWFIAGELVSGLLPESEYERLAEKEITREKGDS